MPRRLLRDGRIVVDEWHYLEEPAQCAGLVRADDQPAPACAATSSPGSGVARLALILPYTRWLAEREQWLDHGARLGVLLEPADLVERLAPDLPRLDMIAVRFPGLSEGRGYSQARQLRERWQFGGEVRAMGYVRQDQVFFLARCGFNAFELPDQEFDAMERAFATFSAEYQTSNNRGLAGQLRHR
jgi:uncharacterized protein (DUF934 family)